MQNCKIREASHAGSWYNANEAKLRKQFDAWLSSANVQIGNSIPKALIGPHAGYTYCGQTAAHAYKTIPKGKFTRVFVLGPSHHLYIDGIAISGAHYCETPFGNLQVCQQTIRDLSKRLNFEILEMQDDEDEHSLEMHFPWIAYTFGVNVKIVPILVGHVTTQTAHKFGKIFAEYLKDPSTFMVISSDFCHWGKRFAYTFYDPNWGPIYKSIEKLDRTGMEAIASLEVETYYAYQKKYKNTICGRNPILILLGAVTASLNKYEMKFVHYSQSSKVVDSNDSSVSYAAGVLYEM